ncbi:hypothetical protein JCM33374_g1481 [Metschnikowia sp. JCM 33374]|nr:hypothetical protein JCM33374_g1481 [Metschnikowia sp. JCM 33374]
MVSMTNWVWAYHKYLDVEFAIASWSHAHQSRPSYWMEQHITLDQISQEQVLKKSMGDKIIIKAAYLSVTRNITGTVAPPDPKHGPMPHPYIC